MVRQHLTKLVLNRAGMKPPLPGGLGAGAETTGTMLGSGCSRDHLQSLSPLLLQLLRENQETNQRENTLRFSHQLAR